MLYLDGGYVGLVVLPAAAAAALPTACLQVPLTGDAREENTLVVRECALGRVLPSRDMVAVVAAAVADATPWDGKLVLSEVPGWASVGVVNAAFRALGVLPEATVLDPDAATAVITFTAANTEVRDLILGGVDMPGPGGKQLRVAGPRDGPRPSHGTWLLEGTEDGDPVAARVRVCLWSPPQ
jgi:hypothetical protein